MPSLTPCLWVDVPTEDAIAFYRAVLPDLTLVESSPLRATIEVHGQRLHLLAGRTGRPFSEAFSLVLECETQDAVDAAWAALVSDGGAESQCGWLTDRFGVSWQILPAGLGRVLGDPDPARAGRALEALLRMRRIDLAALERAADGADDRPGTSDNERPDDSGATR